MLQTLLSPVHTSNNVEATFDFVKRIVRLVAFDSVASTLLLLWTGFRVKGRAAPTPCIIWKHGVVHKTGST